MDFSRRSILAAALAIPAAAALGKPARPSARPLRQMLVIDGLGAVFDPYSPPQEVKLSPRAVAELKASGLSAVNVTVGYVGNDPNLWRITLDGIAQYDRLLAANPDFLMAIRTPGDFVLAKAQGKLGVQYGTQDTSMVGTELNRVARLKAMGVRQMQLTYNLRNLSGDGALEEANAGLSRLGIATIEEIEAQRILLDLSHGGARTMLEAATRARRPPIISHTACRNLFDHPRNSWDEPMRIVADKGGCVGIYFMPYLTEGSQPTGDHLIAHLDHARRVCGEDHISIGTDGNVLPMLIDDAARKAQKAEFEQRKADGFAAPGEGPDVFPVVMDYNSVDKFERLALALNQRGWSDDAVEKLFGANLLRLYTDTWG